MRRHTSVHTVRLVLGLVAASLSVLGAARGATETPSATAQTASVVVSHG